MQNFLASPRLCLWTFAFASKVYAQTYLVATSGSDFVGDGTIGHPFATLAHAVLVARTNSVHHIVVRAGDYHNTELLLNELDNGLIIEAETGERPVLYGGATLSGWATNGAFQEASLPAFPAEITTMTNWQPRMLLVDGVPIPQARLPNDPNKWFYYGVSNNSKTSFTFDPSDISASMVTNNVEIGALFTYNYSRMYVVGLDTLKKAITLSPPAFMNFGFGGSSNYCIWNTREGMYPGSWYHDRITGKIIVQTNSLAGKTVIVPTCASIIAINADGKWHTKVSTVFSGLQFVCSAAPIVGTLNYAADDPGAIEGKYTDGVVITNCVFNDLSANAIHFKGWDENVNLTVISCSFSNLGGGAVVFGMPTSSGTVTSCAISRIGLLNPGAGGIYCQGGGSMISHNTITNCTGNGIIFTAGDRNTAVDNVLGNTHTIMQDGGSIYANASRSNVVLRNICYGRGYERGVWARSGLYADGGADWMLFASNIVVNFYDAIHCDYNSNVSYVNNYFLLSSGDIFLFFDHALNPQVTKNIFSYAGAATFYGGAYTAHPDVSDWSSNLFWSPSGNRGVPPAATFANPLLAAGWVLQSPSPALTMGIKPIVHRPSGVTNLRVIRELAPFGSSAERSY